MIRAITLATAIVVFGAEGLQDAVANGDTRSLTLHHVHSGESATVTFKRDGRYDAAALQKLNVLLQDWRRKEPTKMDPQLFDIVWEVYRDVDATQAIEVIGGYRSPETNAMLRARSRGVAQTSLHMQGKAMDFYIPGVPLAKIREAGLRLQRGGVGFYPTSGSPFVHLDTGGIRHWPRMTRDQLARVFPDGKTVHIPADGKPMANYALALADVERRGSRPGGAGAAFASASAGPSVSGGKVKNIFSSLFGKDDEADEEEAPAKSAPAAAPVVAAVPASEPAVQAAPAQTASAPAVAAAAEVVAARSVPLPMPNPLPRPDIAAARTPDATLASAALVPLPPARPGAPAADKPTVVAALDTPSPTLETADVPLPPVRPVSAVADRGGASQPAEARQAVALPSLIVHGGEAPPLALSYAVADDFVVARPAPGRANTPAVVPTPNRVADAARMPQSEATREEIRRLFTGSAVTATPDLRSTEQNQFASLIVPPSQVVDGGFGRDASGGLATARFSGAAVVAVPMVTGLMKP